MKYVIALFASGIAHQLTGCATLSENECRGADWQAIGYRDGSNGHDAGRLASHTEACAEYGIAPDQKEYEIGRLRGLEMFCTSEKGIQVGRQGGSYSGVCPVDIEPEFLRGYDLGRQMYDVDQYLSRLHQDIEQTQHQLDQKDPPLKDSERDRLIYRLRDLEREYGRSESELRQLEMRGRRY
ncbi:MAG: DUF2799 domain-containing protein [Povalibacter sp.]